MRKAIVLYKDEEAGILTQQDDGTFTFTYNDTWIKDSGKPDISLTLPKSGKEFHSKFLFPFFFNLLPEGANKEVVCKLNRIDPDDYFGILTTTANYDTIGAVRVVKTEVL
jgi:HipA-like protein